jgi:ubiquitin C-terminal hydrolase
MTKGTKRTRKCSICKEKGHDKRNHQKVHNKRKCPAKRESPPTVKIPSEIPTVDDSIAVIQKPLGLPNPPDFNCCFMNSTLQLLRSVKELVDYFLSGDPKLVYDTKENVDIAKEFHLLLGAWDNNENLEEEHRKFRDKCGALNQIWNIGEQQDAAHFLLFLLETLDIDLMLII